MDQERVYVCEQLMPVEQAVRLQGLVEEVTGEECPCAQDGTCPLLPARLLALLPGIALVVVFMFATMR